MRDKRRKKMRRGCGPFHMVFVVVILLVGTFAHADNIYVSCGDGTIRKFDSSGNGSVYASGIDAPAGLVFDNIGNLYAANVGDMEMSNGTIEKFDWFGNRSTFASGLQSPMGLAFRSGDLYVVSSLDDPGQIFKFDLSGNGSFFAEAPMGVGAIDLAFDSGGYLYMSCVSGQIFKFDSSGNGSVFASGIVPGGLAFDSSDNLYTATDAAGTIVKFDSSGNSSIFASGLSNPQDLAFDSIGNLYVTEYGGILKFDSSGNSSIFASGLSYPGFITTPEPVTILLLGLGGLALLRKRRA